MTPAIVHEVGRTVRAAIGGWGPTARFAIIIIVCTACAIWFMTI